MYYTVTPILFAETNKGMCRFRYVGNGKFDVTLMKGANQRREINRNTEHFYKHCNDPVLIEACQKVLEQYFSDDSEFRICGNQVTGHIQHRNSNYVRALMLRHAHQVVEDLENVEVNAAWLTHILCDFLKFVNDSCNNHKISKDKADIQLQMQECVQIIKQGVGL